MAKKYYVGKSSKTGKREKFLSATKPTQQSHGKMYSYVIGPFKTKNGAIIMAKYGENNPHLQTVGDAEKMAKKNPEMVKEKIESKSFTKYYTESKDLEKDGWTIEEVEEENALYLPYNEEEDNGEWGQIDERLWKKKVVRAGKKIIKWVTDQIGFRVVPDPAGGRPKLKRVTASEKIKKKKAQKKGAIKRKAKKAQMQLKRKISKRFRGMYGLK